MKNGWLTTPAVLLAAAAWLSLPGCYTQLGTADAEGNGSEDELFAASNDSTLGGESYEDARQRFQWESEYYYPTVILSAGIAPIWFWNSWYYDPWYWYGPTWYPYYGYGWYGGGWYYPPYYSPYYDPYPYPYAHGGGTRTFGNTRGGVSRTPTAYTGSGTGTRTSPTGYRPAERPDTRLPGATVTPVRTAPRSGKSGVTPPRTSRGGRESRGATYREAQTRKNVDAPASAPAYDGGSRRAPSGGGTVAAPSSSSRPSPSSGGGSQGGGSTGGGSRGGSGSGGSRPGGGRR